MKTGVEDEGEKIVKYIKGFTGEVRDLIDDLVDWLSGSGVWEEAWRRMREAQRVVMGSIERLTFYRLRRIRAIVAEEMIVGGAIAVSPLMPPVPVSRSIKTVHLYPTFYFTITTEEKVDIDEIAKKVVKEMSRYV